MRRTVIFTCVVCAWWGWQAWEPRPHEPPPDAPSVSASPTTLDARDPRAESAGARLWARLRGTAEPPPDPVLHCQLADHSTFMRRSKCEREGGFVDHPAWDRLD